jgi:hypothetical protein
VSLRSLKEVSNLMRSHRVILLYYYAVDEITDGWTMNISPSTSPRSDQNVLPLLSQNSRCHTHKNCNKNLEQCSAAFMDNIEEEVRGCLHCSLIVRHKIYTRSMFISSLELVLAQERWWWKDLLDVSSSAASLSLFTLFPSLGWKLLSNPSK